MTEVINTSTLSCFFVTSRYYRILTLKLLKLWRSTEKLCFFNLIHARVAQELLMEEFHRISRLPPYVFNIVNELKAKARAAGEDIIDFGMGNPDQPTPKHITYA